jgi:hypothetical protein
MQAVGWSSSKPCRGRTGRLDGGNGGDRDDGVAVVELNGRTLDPDHPDMATLHTTSTESCRGLAVNGVETGASEVRCDVSCRSRMLRSPNLPVPVSQQQRP